MKAPKNNISKPSPEAKALSLFLMALKAKNPKYKEESKRINKLWDMAKSREISYGDYQFEVQKMVDAYGGYEQIIQKTIRFYLETTGQWQVHGDDTYCQDARKIAEKITSK